MGLFLKPNSLISNKDNTNPKINFRNFGLKIIFY